MYKASANVIENKETCQAYICTQFASANVIENKGNMPGICMYKASVDKTFSRVYFYL